MFVELRKDWQSARFQRSVRDKGGAILRTLVFDRGIPVELNAEDEEAVKADIGLALNEVVPVGRAFVRPEEIAPGAVRSETPAATASARETPSKGGASPPAGEEYVGAKPDEFGSGKARKK